MTSDPPHTWQKASILTDPEFFIENAETLGALAAALHATGYHPKDLTYVRVPIDSGFDHLGSPMGELIILVSFDGDLKFSEEALWNLISDSAFGDGGFSFQTLHTTSGQLLIIHPEY